VGAGFSRLFFALIFVFTAVPVFAQAPVSLVGQPVAEIRIEQEGQPVTDRLITGLVETRSGAPLSMRDVRETIGHLMGLGRFEDVQVLAVPSGAGVIVTYVLVPLHPVQHVEFRGELGLSETELRQAMTERHGELPPATRANDVARTLEALYRDRGYVRARVTPRVEEQHQPDRATLIFEIDAGPRATIQTIEYEGVDGGERTALAREIDVRPGVPYDSRDVEQELEQYERRLRARGYYEARATHSVDFGSDGGAALTIAIDRGPRVSVAFAGDPLPEKVRDDLVPIRREGSADQDLLEDASRAIEDYLKTRGYRDASAPFVREERDGELVITFTVTRGPRHIVDVVDVKGSAAVTTAEILGLVGVKPGDPFVQALVESGANATRDLYRARGFTRAKVEPVDSVLPRPRDGATDGDRHVQVTLVVDEGPRTLVGAITIEGNRAISEAEIRSLMTVTTGRPYYAIQVASDRDRIELEYRNRGYASATVEPQTTLVENDTRADLRLAISEGPQVLIDHVIIVGNARTSTETIERELLLRPGQPLGYSALVESRQRLIALGLFRRVRITELEHGSEPRRDVLVQVDEAPAHSVGFGGGIEGGERLRPTAEGGAAEERFELTPHGFFEIGRRNLWGKNRSVNLFTRVALRARDIVFTREGIRLEEPSEESGYGFNEYRVLANYREPKVFNTPADVLVTGILDQAIRSSFNFITREARVEVGQRVTPIYSVAGRYSYEHTRLFDEKFTNEDKPLIDRLFPQVRLSKLSGSALRDTRSDVLDPDRGTFLAADNDLAARAIGSEVGFVKTYVQAFTFHRLPVRRRTVVGLAARIGAAHGFRRAIARLDPGGNPVLGPDGRPLVEAVQDLPASERFFAGGDTTVRGFSLDRLGDEPTISPTGFPTGGNGLVMLNTELRVAVWGGLGAVGFFDAGNVFLSATDINVTDLRASAGFGLRYRSPVGPIRIDLGFNLDRKELVPGTLERGYVLHIGLGQAF
jgi:outer membrane protein assembly complex protein YaeT